MADIASHVKALVKFYQQENSAYDALIYRTAIHDTLSLITTMAEHRATTLVDLAERSRENPSLQGSAYIIAAYATDFHRELESALRYISSREAATGLPVEKEVLHEADYDIPKNVVPINVIKDGHGKKHT